MRLRTLLITLVTLSLALVFGVLARARPARIGETPTHAGDTGHAAMTDAAMQRWSESWWASHPRVGTASLQAPAATFTVSNFQFDLDNNPSTIVDTAKIAVGESVMWQWVNGTHTVTNGMGIGDAGAGTLFDQPISISSQQFTFAFNTPGTFPFFCRPHELDDMKGVVVVSSAVDVEPMPGGRAGFTAGPSPNPGAGGFRFSFALREPGPVRAELFDASGRRVAVVLDRTLGAGPHEWSWDAGAAGRPAAGLYFLRLRLPGYQGSRAVVVAR